MKDLPDIPFNFLIGDDGNIYDGRGFLYQGDIPRSNRSHIQLNFGLVIAFIGDYSEEPPSTNQTENFFRFLDSSAERDMIDDNFALWLDEDSPAFALNETLSESPHFGSGSSLITKKIISKNFDMFLKLYTITQLQENLGRRRWIHIQTIQLKIRL